MGAIVTILMLLAVAPTGADSGQEVRLLVAPVDALGLDPAASSSLGRLLLDALRDGGVRVATDLQLTIACSTDPVCARRKAKVINADGVVAVTALRVGPSVQLTFRVMATPRGELAIDESLSVDAKGFPARDLFDPLVHHLLGVLAPKPAPSADVEAVPDSAELTATSAPELEPETTTTEQVLAPAHDAHWMAIVAVDGGASILLSAPQDETFATAGPGFGVRAGVLWAPIAVELQAALASFAERDGDRRTWALWLGAGGAAVRGLTSGLEAALRAHAGIARTGALTRFAFDASIGLELSLGAVRVGPFARYAQIVSRARAERARGDAHTLTVGVQVAVPVFTPSD